MLGNLVSKYVELFIVTYYVRNWTVNTRKIYRIQIIYYCYSFSFFNSYYTEGAVECRNCLVSNIQTTEQPSLDWFPISPAHKFSKTRHKTKLVSHINKSLNWRRRSFNALVGLRFSQSKYIHIWKMRTKKILMKNIKR